jgi:hypothetical protein
MVVMSMACQQAGSSGRRLPENHRKRDLEYVNKKSVFLEIKRQI